MRVKKKNKVIKKICQQNKKTMLFVLLSLIFLVFLSFKLVNVLTAKYYKVEPRKKAVEKSKKTDADDYDTIAWVRIQGTDIDYPIILGKEKDFDYPVQVQKYAWSLNESDQFYNKINIMGHNIFNLSSNPKKRSDTFYRFEELMAFVYDDFAEKNKYIQFTMHGEDYVYKIFAAGFVSSTEVSFFPPGENDEDDIDYQLKLFKDTSLYDYDVDVNKNDKLISLITCTRFFGDTHTDFVVTGRLMRKGEKIKNYDVKKNKNYETVEEKLKEGNNDDETL